MQINYKSFPQGKGISGRPRGSGGQRSRSQKTKRMFGCLTDAWFTVQLDYGPINAQQQKLWQTTSGCRQAKMFLYGPDKKLFRFALSLPKRELKF